MNTKTVHSGGAVGADSLFSNIFSTQYNFDVIHHSFNGHNIKSKTGRVLIHSNDELYKNKSIIIEICEYNKKQFPYKEYIQKLLLRNIFQCKTTQLIIGIGQIINFKKGIVKGGTGYAITYGIIHKLPILMLDQNYNKWYFSINGNSFLPLNRSPDINRFPEQITAIGTRKLTSSATNLIYSTFNGEVL